MSEVPSNPDNPDIRQTREQELDELSDVLASRIESIPGLGRRERMEAAIDLRLADLYGHVAEMDDANWSHDAVLVFLRAAYAKGHVDALTEQDPLEFHRSLGYKPPTKASE
jgi:hypothetical protein